MNKQRDTQESTTPTYLFIYFLEDFQILSVLYSFSIPWVFIFMVPSQ